MLARRARIKALAAVPVRKKPQDSVDSNDANDVANENLKKENVSSINETEQEATKNIAKVEVQQQKDVIRNEAASERKEDDISNTDISKQKEQNEEDISSSSLSEQEAVEDVAKIQEEIANQEQSIIRIEESIAIEKSDHQELCSPLKPDSQQLCSPLKPDSQELRAQAKSSSQESPCTGSEPDKVTDQSLQKSILPPDVPTVIDIASPTKIIQNRSCFMRPIPRLDSGGRIRKNSVQGSGASASESEDEHSKRVASVVPCRVRNDSICSVQSNKESIINDSQNSPLKMKTTSKRRMLVSESARKLAEARREFLLKHENKTPDRSKLKMYDLIYYNPVTNPMKKLPAERRQITISQPIERPPEEEDEDDPSAMPMPQVKVGPDGQLIIDEQSLVIEQTTKRSEEIYGETIIEDDSHGGGFYKRHKRSKEWPKWETLKFYRVLNVVGTDFLLMQTLFPNRSRQEIKQKYKKEERVNRPLIEKALKFHQEFDTDSLNEQLIMLQKIGNFHDTSKRASPEKTKSGPTMSRIERKRKHRLVAESIGECEALSTSNDQEEVEDTAISTTNDEIDLETNDDTNNAQQMGKKKARRSKKSLDELEIFGNSSCSDFDSDSSEEVYQLRPTRSGRLSKKIRKLQAPDPNSLNNAKNDESSVSDETAIPSYVAVEVTEYVNTPVTDGGNTEMSCFDNIMSMIPNINQMEPNALVIVSKESAENPGNTILQVYIPSNIDSSTTVTSSAASKNQSSEPLSATSENVESINIADDTEK